MTDNNTITAKQMMRFTFICQTGVGVINLPALLAKEVGHDGWISVAVSGIIAMFLASLIVVLLRRYFDKSIFDITRLIFGKIIGFIINALLCIYFFLVASSGLMMFLNYLKITLFPNTPSIVMAPLTMLPSVYMVWQGTKTVARFKSIALFSYMLVIIYLILLIKEMRFSFLLPVGESGLPALFSSLKTAFFAYIGLELIAVFYPEISDKENALKYHVRATVYSMLFVMLVVVACTALFGENFLSVLNIPLFNLSRVFHAPIIERVDVYLISAWLLAVGCSTRAYLMAAYYSIEKVFKLKKSRIFYTLFICADIGLSQLIVDINKAFMILDIIGWVGIGVIIFIILCLVLSMFRKNGVAENG